MLQLRTEDQMCSIHSYVKVNEWKQSKREKGKPFLEYASIQHLRSIHNTYYTFHIICSLCAHELNWIWFVYTTGKLHKREVQQSPNQKILMCIRMYVCVMWSSKLSFHFFQLHPKFSVSFLKHFCARVRFVQC